MANKKAIVVGSGLAGLSAASTLLSHHIPVILLDRAAKPGGNSIKASSGINGAPTRFQSGPGDSVDLFAADTIKSAGSVFAQGGEADRREPLVRKLTSESAGAIEWLVNGMGVDLSRTAQLWGHSRARTHRGKGKIPPGYAIVSALLKELQGTSLFELRGESEVVKILRDEKGRVNGVRYRRSGVEEESLEGPVIFTAGGFAGDSAGMLKEYRPDLGNFPSTNDPRPGAHKLLTDVGAKLVDMGFVQIHPTGFIDPANRSNMNKFLAAEALRAEGGVLLNRDGKRFVNELATRLEVTGVIMSMESKSENPKQWDVQLVLDEGAYQAAQTHVDFYIFKNLMCKVRAAEMDATMRAELQAYGDIVSGASADPHGRAAFGHWSSRAPIKDDDFFYVGDVTPVIHFTMGGAWINTNAEVVKAEGGPIEGLWAAGEITGGIHGENRLGGSSLLECVVFGRTAGENVAKYLSKVDL
ncbi:Flavocytochrome c [Rhizodiscina lignyota]|uniref:Fumarate reductase n=1 Tax=Rhizodiscina lignyota TaxID=1504668 RepID=A0A9P4ILB4_9PEZI|nr:Flavocytochrome c [Rhizodiscina lignyota]